MNCQDRAALENIKAIGFVLLVLVIALFALLAGCDERRCREQDLNEFQRMACP